MSSYLSPLKWETAPAAVRHRSSSAIRLVFLSLTCSFLAGLYLVYWLMPLDNPLTPTLMLDFLLATAICSMPVFTSRKKLMLMASRSLCWFVLAFLAVSSFILFGLKTIWPHLIALLLLTVFYQPLGDRLYYLLKLFNRYVQREFYIEH